MSSVVSNALTAESAWGKFLLLLREAGLEDVIELFDLDLPFDFQSLHYNGYNYNTFKKEHAWRSEDGILWQITGKALFNFRVPRGKYNTMPPDSELFTISKTLNNITLILYCKVQEHHLQDYSDLGMRISVKCGVAMLTVACYDLVSSVEL